MGEGESVLTTLLPGEIYEAFDISGKKRPHVVVSRAELNHGNYFLAVPFTSGRVADREARPTNVRFDKGQFGLTKVCFAQAEGLTLLRRSDLTQPPTRIGTISDKKLAALVHAIGHAIAADCSPEQVPA